MNTTTIALIIVGITAAIILAMLVIFLYRIIKMRERSQKKIRVLTNGKVREDIYKAVDTVEIPFTFRKIEGQSPGLLITPQPSSAGSSPSSDKVRNRNRSPILQTQASTISYPGVITKKRDERQRKISEYMMMHLSKQGKMGTNVLATLLPENESNLLRAGSSSSLYSEDSDDSSVSGISVLSGVSGASSVSGGPNINGKNEDLFDSAELGSGKKRIGAKRGSSVPRKSYKKSGKITFTTEYSTDTKTLEVHILRVFDLISRKHLNEINPFVNVFLHPGKHQKYSTKYHKGTRNPYINEKVFFKDIEKDSFNRYKLRFRVYHYSRVKTKELLGELEVALSSLDTNVKETFNVDLFIMNQQKSDPGKMCVSLCHQATFSKLEVIIQEAKHLRGSSSKLSVYVTAALYDENGIQQKETTVKRSKRPEFNEALDFTVHTNSSTPLDIYSLVLTVNIKSKIGKDEIIGHVIFSAASPQQSAVAHWEKLRNEPHKRFSEWHVLLDPNDI